MNQIHSTNPYSASNDPFEETRPSPSGLTAIIIGAFIGDGILYAAGTALSWVIMWHLSAQGATGKDLYLPLYQSTGYLLAGHVVAGLAMLIGGYWCARLGNDRRLFRAAMAGLIIMAQIMLHLTLPYDQPYPLWTCVVSLVMPIPLYVAGAMLWRRPA